MMMLVAGLLIFLGVHSLSIVNHPLRDRLATRLGPWGWRAAFSVVALLGLVLIIHGYGAARLDPVLVYAPPTWLRHVSLLLLVFIFPLLLAAYLPGRISRATRHPMLLATKIWAFAHLLANGMLHDIVLFGAFLAWAVADRISLKRRSSPPAPAAPQSAMNDVIAVVAGLGLYVWFVMHGHAWLFGVAPVAMG
jgi:uncharacterized membrane protein